MSRVVVLHDQFPTTLDYPSARTARVLHEDGHDVVVLTRGRWPRALDAVRLVVADTLPGLAAQLLRLRPDLLLLEQPTVHLLLLPLVRRSWVRSPVPSASPTKRAVQRLALHRATAVTLTNPAHERTWALPARQVRDLPYPVDLAFWRAPQPREDGLWTARGLPVPAGPVLCSVASLMPGKRQDELVRALAPLLRARPDVVLAVGGWVRDPGVAARVREHAEQAGVADRVHLLGPLSPAEVRHLFAWSSVHVITSRLETQSLVLYEGLAAGVPAVLPDYDVLTTAFPDLLRHADDDSLRGAVERHLDDPALGPAVVAAAQDRLAWSDARRHDALLRAHAQELLARAPS